MRKMWIKQDVVRILGRGGIGVLPTDTIYGLVGSALKKKTVERIYKLRRRNPKKPMIILIDSIARLKSFGITPSITTLKHLRRFWPHLRRGYGGQRPISVTLPISRSTSDIRKWKYLHRGTKTLAFRMPKPEWLKILLRKTGPLVAPSANLEGKPPAKTIGEATEYFRNKLDFYIDGGKLKGKSSKLVQIVGQKINILRK